MLASEAVPLAKTGGLADVVGALVVELTRLGHEVRLVLPRYRGLEDGPVALRETHRFRVPLRHDDVEVALETGTLKGDKGPVVCVRYDPFFDRPGLYGDAAGDYPDNLDRFALFCRAAIEACKELGWAPDIVHAHDWQTALAIVYLKTLYQSDTTWTAPRTLFTIHNMGYQGLFPPAEYPATGLPAADFTAGGLEFYGQINLLKGGMIYADLLNTVSPTYAKEIQTPEYGYRLEGVLQTRKDRLFGIINGIDYDVWNPTTDVHIAANYSQKDMSGKKTCKTALRRELKLPQRDVPLLGMVSRLALQKGIDLLVDTLPKLLALDVQMVMLGSGDALYQAELTNLSDRFVGKFAVRLGFDEGLAHRIEAGADMFVMPSRYEPCGLNQLYSLRYGTIPVVRKTGGLADTVVPYLPGHAVEKATGFVFEDAHPEVLLSTLYLVLQVYRDKTEWADLIKRGMKQDFSWKRSAKEYVALYERALVETKPAAPPDRDTFPRGRFR